MMNRHLRAYIGSRRQN